jgi:tyrosyl-tRNA synthetase
MRPQVAMLMPIITGLCGTQKMSKSLNNYIAVLDNPNEQFGKTMSIPDVLMPEWAKYLSGWSQVQVEKFQQDLASGVLHPNKAKKDLASALVSFFHGHEVGESARVEFEHVFAQKNSPTDIQSVKFDNGEKILDLLLKNKVITTMSEGRRLVQQGGVSFHEGEKILDVNFAFASSHEGQILKVGKKKFLRLSV